MLKRILRTLSTDISDQVHGPGEKIPALLEELKCFEIAWREQIEKFRNDPLDWIPVRTVNYGDFVAAVRSPGQKSGSSAGQVPGLEWTTVPFDSAEIPHELSKRLLEIKQKPSVLEFAELPFCPGCILWHLWFESNPRHPNFDADAFVILPKTQPRRHSFVSSIRRTNRFTNWDRNDISECQRTRKCTSSSSSTWCAADLDCSPSLRTALILNAYHGNPHLPIVRP